jgi:hypothetical protein
MSNRELAEKLRSRAKFLSGLDWQLMREAADALEGSDSLTGEQVMAYFTKSDIKLLPWQLQRLLSKPKVVSNAAPPKLTELGVDEDGLRIFTDIQVEEEE